MLSGDLILVWGPDYIVYCVQSAGHPLGRVIGYFVKILSVITSDIWTEWPHIVATYAITSYTAD